MTVFREPTVAGQSPSYIIKAATLSLNYNKIRNGDPTRILNLKLSDQFFVRLGPCPYSVGTLSLQSDAGVPESKALAEFSEKSILNAATGTEDALLECSVNSIRPFVDLSRLLRM